MESQQSPRLLSKRRSDDRRQMRSQAAEAASGQGARRCLLIRRPVPRHAGRTGRQRNRSVGRRIRHLHLRLTRGARLLSVRAVGK
jgi:hypothetical protein